MQKHWIALCFVVLAWSGTSEVAAAQHQMPWEFQGTHVALSIERFMGIDYVDFEGPGGGDVTARLLLNASEPVPTSLGRAGIDVFIKRFSIGVAGGVTSEDVGILAPRIGYLFGLTPTIGLWLRAGGFYAAVPGVKYAGITGEILFAWFPYEIFAIHLGPTIDVAFANDPHPNYVALGIPELGMSVWFD
jgi:hypothetical protein